MFRGTIVDAFNKDGEWYAVIQPRSYSARSRRVIAPLSKGGEVGFDEDGTGHPWIFKGTMECLPIDGTEVLYRYYRGENGHDHAALWCTAEAWNAAEDMVRELCLRLRLKEITDLMMPETLCPNGRCGYVEIDDDEETYASWISESVEPEMEEVDWEPGQEPYMALGKFVDLFTAIPAF